MAWFRLRDVSGGTILYVMVLTGPTFPVMSVAENALKSNGNAVYFNALAST